MTVSKNITSYIILAIALLVAIVEYLLFNNLYEYTLQDDRNPGDGQHGMVYGMYILFAIAFWIANGVLAIVHIIKTKEKKTLFYSVLGVIIISPLLFTMGYYMLN